MILEDQEHGTSSAPLKASCWWHHSWNLCQMIRQKSREKAEAADLPYTNPFSCDLIHFSKLALVPLEKCMPMT